MSVENPSAREPQSSSMARLIGGSAERWSLSRAIDALGDAARQVGAPGWIWLAGIFYPTLSLGFANTGEFALRFSERVSERAGHDQVTQLVRDPWLGLPLVMAPALLPILMRLIVGLARISTPQAWESLTQARRVPRLRDAWAAGRGLALASLGLWLQLLLMVIAAGIVLIVPPFIFLRGTGLREWSTAFVLLLGPFAAVWMIYALLLSVIYQLALHSLAQNHRGVASALIHAWRIARNHPWATARTMLVDFLLYLTIVALAIVTSAVLAVTCIGIPLVFLVWPLTAGFAGVTRAAYWARAYRALGGLSPEDGVPGL